MHTRVSNNFRGFLCLIIWEGRVLLSSKWTRGNLSATRGLRAMIPPHRRGKKLTWYTRTYLPGILVPGTCVASAARKSGACYVPGIFYGIIILGVHPKMTRLVSWGWALCPNQSQTWTDASFTRTIGVGVALVWPHIYVTGTGRAPWPKHNIVGIP